MKKQLITTKRIKGDAAYIGCVTNNGEAPIEIAFPDANLSHLYLCAHETEYLPDCVECEDSLFLLEHGYYKVLELSLIYYALTETARRYGWCVLENDDRGLKLIKNHPQEGWCIEICVASGQDLVESVRDYFEKFGINDYVDEQVKNDPDILQHPSALYAATTKAEITFKELKELDVALHKAKATGQVQFPQYVVIGG